MAVERVRCSLCIDNEGTWDIIGDLFVCPACEEALAAGTAPKPLQQKLVARKCVICPRAGSVPFQTLPHSAVERIELDLCPDHFGALIGRHFIAHTFRRLEELLHKRGLEANDIFLLSDDFYDAFGNPKHPVVQEWD